MMGRFSNHFLPHTGDGANWLMHSHRNVMLNTESAILSRNARRASPRQHAFSAWVSLRLGSAISSTTAPLQIPCLSRFKSKPALKYDRRANGMEDKLWSLVMPKC